MAAPSANRFGRISPTSAEDVREELGDRIDWIVDGGQCEVGVESTIVSVSESGELNLFRPGGLGVDEIESTAHCKLLRPEVTVGEAQPAQAPGMLASHYAPRKKLLLLPTTLRELKEIPSGWKLEGKIALLTVLTPEREGARIFAALSGGEPRCRSLTESGDLHEAARNLFRTLRELDSSDASMIVAEPCPIESGLGFAIGDRLRRAAAPRD